MTANPHEQERAQRLVDSLYGEVRSLGCTMIGVPGADGIVLAYAGDVSEEHALKFCAAVSGLSSLTRATAKDFRLGAVRQQSVEMDHGHLIVIANRAHHNSIALLATPDADLEVIVYRIVGMTEKIGEGMSSPARVADGH